MGLDYLRLLYSHVWQSMLGRFKELGPDTAVAPQATFSISLWFLKMLSSALCLSSTHNSYMSSQGTQDMCLKRDSKVEATSHFMTCKSLWHVCHILFVKVVTKVHQISRGGHLHLLFCWKSFSIILQEDDVLTYILGWVFLENIVWKGPPSGHNKSNHFTLKRTLIPSTRTAKSHLIMALPKMSRCRWDSPSTAVASYQGNLLIYFLAI